ncbi:FAD-dependent oxidoreductase [Micromonospora sagamiensis]|uniref:FAD-dependent oxidoreductase n=1 Tax=Micromonospora sagamiensis TaxID=47875 RepID=UPI0018E16B62|nr:FAD-dependent oxidoreductase [Micromonospora sagamiensis]
MVVETEDGRVPDSVLRTPNRSFACGLHCVPRSDGSLYVGATNIISYEPRKYALLSDLKFLIECAMDQLHTGLDDASLQKLQVGNRPIPADGFPLFGRLDGTANVWMATGTYRDGLHQSPLLAQQMADMLGGREAHPALRDFVPVRPPLPTGTRDEIVDRQRGVAQDPLVEPAGDVPQHRRQAAPDLHAAVGAAGRDRRRAGRGSARPAAAGPDVLLQGVGVT